MGKVAVEAAGKCGNRIGFGLERVAGEPECSIRIEIGYHGDEVYQRMRRHLGRPVARVVLAVLAVFLRRQGARAGSDARLAGHLTA
ncbi:hypothetical protein [Cupriavidus necator]|uniref:hypothetical protein n=1 Tax=Cupriavidus necator TaxID=106590 RepID=UPI002783E779|nr:hypothetical protein [Cupriavidus necator]MDQ0141048.1 hypothetical protein [Cupriavidus necator]